MRVRILKQLPKYNAADGAEMPARIPGEECEIVKEEAEWLIRGKLAESLEPLEGEDAG